MNDHRAQDWATTNSNLGSILVSGHASVSPPLDRADLVLAVGQIGEMTSLLHKEVARFDAMHERIYGFRKPSDGSPVDGAHVKKEGLASALREQIELLGRGCRDLHELATALEKFI